MVRKEVNKRTSKRAQWVKALTTSPDSMSSVPRKHVVEGGSEMAIHDTDIYLEMMVYLESPTYLAEASFDTRSFLDRI